MRTWVGWGLGLLLTACDGMPPEFAAPPVEVVPPRPPSAAAPAGGEAVEGAGPPPASRPVAADPSLGAGLQTAPPSSAPTPRGPVVCGLDPKVSGAFDPAVAAIGRSAGVEHVDAFVSVVNHLQQRGELPDCYLTKAEADARGWRPGEALWSDVPGGAIGGDRFGNREGRLPASGRGYIEADLDDDGGRRGAARLVFEPGGTRDWKIWVTTDHYGSFQRVDPRAAGGGR